ncbi:hypothetical protein LMH87_004522 [Akanthomyces muscarius]|uniref:Inosine triphosphate pyrophosphatase n=1 Tax=Akanthomyces muscarius TaxID=2231603 RepID=A0A9W8Q5T9_AKAMU|nr:hypothetical protein LMH87_004522 [Akanthomyces muscarius]KAJ4145682.1 hypothetical protein LMH87_004522 [Akanthomyces muscarius]
MLSSSPVPFQPRSRDRCHTLVPRSTPITGHSKVHPRRSIRQQQLQQKYHKHGTEEFAMAPRVHFITGNANKLSEVKAILEPEIEVQSLSIDLEEVQGSVEEVTLSKCQRAADIVDGPVLVEDTALCFNALGGLPGVYIKCCLLRQVC